MKKLYRALSLGLVLLAVPAFAGDKFHEGKSALTAEEKASVLNIKEKDGSGFSTFWRNPEVKEFGLLKFDADSSYSIPDAPQDLLDSIRDNIGKLNQKTRPGDPLTITVTVFKFKKQGFLTNPVAFFEIVARTKDGKPAWIAIDRVKSTQELAQSLADSDSAIIGREVFRKMREEFNL